MPIAKPIITTPPKKGPKKRAVILGASCLVDSKPLSTKVIKKIMVMAMNDIEKKDNGSTTKGRKARRLLVGGCNHKNGLRRAKKVVFSPFNELQKLINKKCTRSSSSHTAKPTSNLSRNISTSGIGNSDCCLCFSKPQTLDAPFYRVDTNHEDLKSLIEKNGFFTKECNTHFGN